MVHIHLELHGCDRFAQRESARTDRAGTPLTYAAFARSQRVEFAISPI